MDYYCSEGGGVYSSGAALITDCEIISNSAIDYCGVGGGICAYGSTVLTNSIIMYNDAGDQAGGICCSGSPTIVNCIIAENSTVSGGGIMFKSCNTTMTNCTVVNNSAAMGSGFNCDNCSATLTNCIIADYVHISGGTPSITHCDVWGGYPGTGNINCDPIFTAGYHLSNRDAGESEHSPCIDVGDNPSTMICFEGSSGIICMNQLSTRTDMVPDNNTVDMGYHYPVISVPLVHTQVIIVLVMLFSSVILIILYFYLLFARN